ncbi:hydroxymethylpyrimidine/phosphomethylpyrimidine kinase [Algiphilus sp. NNCM1]|uniref:bifunctional hydroxymethylpyrimidine kinase/phosphomethylpyrimidine kinase n=1 Tax=Algiphilus sp. TaxID=1872431 RepID=UPI001CA76277|nr:hydroxymethylpyrimidine/phosphomethylpyrimidine kinase [Algiphilus sp.]MBY8964926.1 hydroxymethylpyrimidine/phosphomethylpyrimidine kinase [Algiphilus acroporae]MCI5062610.1 hydroxymethylpyrimidine/phosphomethylpyrimidine kinase [Algiphilus sp.]MCI5104314.1 hydroxymethylpyrimidine/phosphomethylpyrimidine kinase [Algiphilus sp.]
MEHTAAQQLPTVLCISGHDPTGGAGLHADIEACQALGAHALGAITALTIQDTHNVHAVRALDAEWFEAQLRRLDADCHIDAIKFGVLGSTAQVEIAARWVRRWQLPMVLDPVLQAGGGAELASQPVARALRDELLPLATVVTPNAAEARLLSGAQRLSDAAVALGARGAAHVLVTGGDEAGTEPRTDWHWHDGAVRALSRSRWAQSYHGAGCTLAASIAALLARGLSPTTAIDQASAQVHAWLGTPKVIGGGRPSPLRQGPVAP